MEFDIGDDANLTATFRVDGQKTDPGSVVCKVKTPAGVTTTYTYGVSAELTRSGVGIFVCKVPLTAAGTWRYRFEGTSPAKGAEEGSFLVNPQTV